MKMNMCLIFGLMIFTAGCNSEVGNKNSNASSHAVTLASVSANGCNATKDEDEEITISCADGSSAKLKKGMQGTQGVTGPTGSGGKSHLFEHNKAEVGEHMVSMIYGSYTIFSKSYGTAIYNSSTGDLSGRKIYYATSNCTGPRYVDTTVPMGFVFMDKGPSGDALRAVGSPLTIDSYSYTQSNGTPQCGVSTSAGITVMGVEVVNVRTQLEMPVTISYTE